MIKINKVLAGLTLILSVNLLTPGLRAEEFGIYKEGKNTILISEGERFEVDYKDVYGYLKMEGIPGKVSTSISLPAYKGKSLWFGGRYLEEAKILLDKEDEKVIYLKGYAHSQKKVEGKNTRPKTEEVYLEMNLRIKKGFPCLFVQQRLVSTVENPLKIYFFSSSGGAHFQKYRVSGEEAVQETPSKWCSLGKKDWIWVGLDKEKGMGIISPSTATFQFDPRNHLNWAHTRKLLEEGAILEMPWIILFKAKDPEEVKSLYEKVKDMELEPFLSPGEQLVMLSNFKSGT